MASQLQEIFQVLKCTSHNLQSIVQVCVSSRCTQINRLCCLQCVDESHSGADHVLISQHKFLTLIKEFDNLIEEKQVLSKKLFMNLQKQKIILSKHIDNFYSIIRENLSKDKDMSVYQEINATDLESTDDQDIKSKINDLVYNHSWILELNMEYLQSHEVCDKSQVNITEQALQSTRVKYAFQSKYKQLQEQLLQINKATEVQIKQVLQKQAFQIKKAFHLFQEIQYKLQDDGKQPQTKLSTSKSKETHLNAAFSAFDSPQEVYINVSQQNKELQQSPNHLNDLIDDII